MQVTNILSLNFIYNCSIINILSTVMITRYGIDNFIIMILLGLAFISFGVWINQSIKFIFIPLGVLLILFAIWFFRDPTRDVPMEAQEDKSLIVSPADGEIVEIIEEEEKHYLKAKAIRISIFLSPLDVHVNRNPVCGKVEYFSYNPGKYLIASLPKASELNEHTKIGILTDFGQKIAYKQITGAVARRIVCIVKEGDYFQTGQKIGMMKFGSRMDVFLPVNSEIYVKVGDKVTAAEQIIAKLKNGN